MATSTETEQQLSLKLLGNKESNKVIFAEAEKDFVDILCSFLTLPLGTIVRLAEKDSDMGPVTVGCLNSLYHSVSDLDKECFWDEKCKEMLLQPTNSSEDYCNTLKIKIEDEPTKYFICSKLDICPNPRVSISPNKKCPWCRSPLNRFVFLKDFSKGFVSSVVTFLITDELIVMPNSMDYISLEVLQYFAIKGRRSVEEITVNVTKKKVLDLLKCALLSKSTLTDLFLRNKPSLEKLRFFSCDVESISTTIPIKLKLFIRKTDGKILFAHGEEDFADLILSFLTFPLGVVVSKLGGKCSFGSIDGLHKRIADLDEKRYFLSREAKSKLFDPPYSPEEQSRFWTQIIPFQQPDLLFYCHFQRETYQDSVIHNDFFINHKYMRANCKKTYCIDPKVPSREVYVKDPRTYVVTDDLVIAPASPISALGLINQFATPLKYMQEKVITIGYKECLNILKASLTSTSALTNGLCHLLAEVKKEISD